MDWLPSWFFLLVSLTADALFLLIWMSKLFLKPWKLWLIVQWKSIMEVLTKPAWFGSESQRQLLSLRVMEKVGEKQWQKIPDPIFGLCLSCVTPSASSGSFITGSFYQFIKANPQVHQINKRWIEKWECLYSSTRMQVFPHLQVHESFIFQGDYRGRDEGLIRHLI